MKYAGQAPRRFTRPQLVAQVKQWTAEGLQVFCVQESCGFGFTLHRELVAAGAQSFLITPIALNGRRKTDKVDARALCLRLSRWLDGNRHELSPIRIPTEAEQRRRETTRRRQFLVRQRRQLANRGHGQAGEYAHLKLPHRWWGARNWPKLASHDPWLLDVLAKLRELILAVEAQLADLDTELKARVQGAPRPKGLGALTLGTAVGRKTPQEDAKRERLGEARAFTVRVTRSPFRSSCFASSCVLCGNSTALFRLTLATLDAEVCDWHRFHNRKQVGSYTGCCPGEHSSGGQRRLGSIDRMGNGRVRALLVEGVWRLLLWQPGWKAAQRLKVNLAAGPALKKKTVVALARQLAIDLWRWRTGRCTLEDLGWIAA
jgi:transposase